MDVRSVQRRRRRTRTDHIDDGCSGRRRRGDRRRLELQTECDDQLDVKKLRQLARHAARTASSPLARHYRSSPRGELAVVVSSRPAGRHIQLVAQDGVCRLDGGVNCCVVYVIRPSVGVAFFHRTLSNCLSIRLSCLIVTF